MIKSMYDLIADTEITSLDYFFEIKVDILFEPIINIQNIEADPSRGIEAFKFEEDDKIKMIKYVVCCFSKDSKYLKSSDTVFVTKSTVIEYLEIGYPLSKRIMAYQIPELESVVSRYIDREDNEHIREYMIAKNIYDRNLNASNSAIDNAGNIDVKSQKMYYEAAIEFKNKMFALKQEFTNKNYMYESVKEDFFTSIKSCFISDLIK